MKIINSYGDGPAHLDDYDEIEITTNGEDIVIIEIIGAPDDDGTRKTVSCHMPMHVAKGVREAIILAIDAVQDYSSDTGKV